MYPHLVAADSHLPSYFVATAAVELGVQARGHRHRVRLQHARRAALMREGKLDFMGGLLSFVALRAFPEWKGAKVLRARAVLLLVPRRAPRSRGEARRSSALKGLRIRRRYRPGQLSDTCSRGRPRSRARQDLIVPPPPTYGDKGYMARNGIDAITQGLADAYWATGCGSRSARNSASPSCISICGAATARPGAATTISPR